MDWEVEKAGYDLKGITATHAIIEPCGEHPSNDVIIAFCLQPDMPHLLKAAPKLQDALRVARVHVQAALRDHPQSRALSDDLAKIDMALASAENKSIADQAPHIVRKKSDHG